MQILKSIIYTTIAFGIIFALYILYDFELFMKEIYQMDLFQFAKSVVIVYFIFLGVSLLITHCMALYRYNKAFRSTKVYYANLKKLSAIYGEEE